MCINDTDELALVLPEDMTSSSICAIAALEAGLKEPQKVWGTSSGKYKVVYILTTMLHAVMLYELAVWSGVANS